MSKMPTVTVARHVSDLNKFKVGTKYEFASDRANELLHGVITEVVPDGEQVKVTVELTLTEAEQEPVLTSKR